MSLRINHDRDFRTSNRNEEVREVTRFSRLFKRDVIYRDCYSPTSNIAVLTSSNLHSHLPAVHIQGIRNYLLSDCMSSVWIREMLLVPRKTGYKFFWKKTGILTFLKSLKTFYWLQIDVIIHVAWKQILSLSYNSIWCIKQLAIFGYNGLIYRHIL